MSQSRLHSLFELAPDAHHETRRDAEAEADHSAGRVIPHARVRDWLIALSRGETEAEP